MKFNNKHNGKYITKDGIEKWDSRACAVVCHITLIQNKNVYYLIGKRGSGGDHPGKFNVPCGYIDWNENLHDAMRREVWEETGLNIDLLLNDNTNTIFLQKTEQPWYVNTDPIENRQNISMHVGLCINIGNKSLPELSLDNMEENESDGAYWVKSTDLSKLSSKSFAFNHKERIKQFLKLLDQIF